MYRHWDRGNIRVVSQHILHTTKASSFHGRLPELRVPIYEEPLPIPAHPKTRPGSF